MRVCNENDDCLANDIPGCTQVNACNYNPDATVDDGPATDSATFAMTATSTAPGRGRRGPSWTPSATP